MLQKQTVQLNLYAPYHLPWPGRAGCAAAPAQPGAELRSVLGLMCCSCLQRARPLPTPSVVLRYPARHNSHSATPVLHCPFGADPCASRCSKRTVTSWLVCSEPSNLKALQQFAAVCFLPQLSSSLAHCLQSFHPAALGASGQCYSITQWITLCFRWSTPSQSQRGTV